MSISTFSPLATFAIATVKMFGRSCVSSEACLPSDFAVSYVCCAAFFSWISVVDRLLIRDVDQHLLAARDVRDRDGEDVRTLLRQQRGMFALGLRRLVRLLRRLLLLDLGSRSSADTRCRSAPSRRSRRSRSRR